MYESLEHARGGFLKWVSGAQVAITLIPKAPLQSGIVADRERH
jgi:hypothetical protein